MSHSEYPCAACPRSPALSVTEMPWVHFPALCHPVCDQHTRFPRGEPSRTLGADAAPGCPVEHQPVLVPAGAAQLRAVKPAQPCPGARLSPGCIPGWQGIFQSPHGPWGAPAAGTSGTAFPAQQLRGWSSSRGMHGMGCHRRGFARPQQ